MLDVDVDDVHTHHYFLGGSVCSDESVHQEQTVVTTACLAQYPHPCRGIVGPLLLELDKSQLISKSKTTVFDGPLGGTAGAALGSETGLFMIVIRGCGLADPG